MLTNLLIAASRQYNPIHEWILTGVRNLVGKANWALYYGALDRDANSFHHESLLPFSAAVIAGGDGWLGADFEKFYGILARHQIPLLAFGLELPRESTAFSASEKTCFLRQGNLITVKDQATQAYFQRYDLNTHVTPCPSIFAFDGKARPRRSKVGFVLQNNPRGKYAFSDASVRELCAVVAKTSTALPTDVICPLIDDFMRFSLMYPRQVKYSYDAIEYAGYFADCDVIVTTSPEVAAVANGCLRPVLLVGEATKDFNPAALPFTVATTMTELEARTRKVLSADHIEEKINQWKESCRDRWNRLLADTFEKALPHEPRQFSAHA